MRTRTRNLSIMAGAGVIMATLMLGEASTASTPGVTEFTACVRANGLKDFTGVTITGDGRIQLNAAGSGTDVLSTEYRKAVAACRHLLPSGSTVPTAPDPAAPSAPDLGFSCSGTCPRTPEAPEPPR
jgi:hypothetical protein